MCIILLSVSSNLVNFSSNFESYSDTEFLELSQNIQQADDILNNKLSKQNESELSSGVLIKENVF